MPREVIPLAIVISNFIHFLLGWAVFFVTFLLVLPIFDFGGFKPLPTLWAFPLITLITALFTTGLLLWASALNVFYDDVKYVLQTVFSLLLFLLPVLYPADVFYYSSVARQHPWLYKVYMLNPITAVVDAYRKTILLPVPRGSFNLKGEPLMMNWGMFAGASLITVLFALSGYWYFNYRKWQFVERP